MPVVITFLFSSLKSSNSITDGFLMTSVVYSLITERLLLSFPFFLTIFSFSFFCLSFTVL